MRRRPCACPPLCLARRECTRPEADRRASLQRPQRIVETPGNCRLIYVLLPRRIEPDPRAIASAAKISGYRRS